MGRAMSRNAVCACIMVSALMRAHGAQEKEDWINAVGRAIVRHSKRRALLATLSMRPCASQGRLHAPCATAMSLLLCAC